MNVPYFHQKDLFSCGAVATKMVLAFYGIHQEEGHLRKVLHTSLKGGTSLVKIQDYLESLGFKCDLKTFEDKQAAFEALEKAVKENPVMVIVNRLIYNQKTPRTSQTVNWESDTFSNHIIVVTKVNESQVSFNDPLPEIGQISLDLSIFLKAWFSKQDGGLMLKVAQPK